jgi:GNAT superfamily N-acetyltransferase
MTPPELVTMTMVGSIYVEAMTIRPATSDDLDEIAALIRELAVYERLEHEIEWDDPAVLAAHLFGPTPAAHVTIAETPAGEVAGFALWFTTFSTWVGVPGIWLEDLFVRPAHRGHGYGRGLLVGLLEASPGRVEWNVLDWNEPSIAFYRSLGAEPVDGWTRFRWVAPDR